MRIAKSILSMFCFLLMVTGQNARGQAGGDLNLQVHGVRINVTDVDEAIDFYANVIGFQVDAAAGPVELINEGIHLQFKLVENPRAMQYGLESQTILVFQTNNLDSAITAYKARGVEFISEKKENGVGFSIPFRDPFGNVLSLMDQSKFPEPAFKEPRIYNVGYHMSDLEKAKAFYCDKLNFKVRSTRYLPALPLNHNDDKTFAFMLHQLAVRSVSLDPSDTQVLLVFSCKNIESTLAMLRARDIPISKVANEQSGLTSYYITDPFGNISQLIEE